MSLIDEVIDYNATSIRATTLSHHNPDNPLRGDQGGLHGIHNVEYAAQTMAIHGGLLAGAAADGLVSHAPRFAIGALRGVEITCDDLTKLPGSLVIIATLELNAASGAIYRFEVRHTNSLIATGRITLIQDGT